MHSTGHTYSIVIILLFIFSCSDKHKISLKPDLDQQNDAVTVANGNLTVTFIDNTSWDSEHKAGYNGIAELSHSEIDSALFVLFYAGFNLEHVFSGDSLVQLFEPRKHPMSLYRKNENEVLLYQEATPISGVESLSEFNVVEPHYIDVTFRCILHNPDFFQHGYAGLFWASYINRPKDKKIYFKGTDSVTSSSSWIEAFSSEHGSKSTHLGIDDDATFFFANNFNARLASHFSDYRFTEPFYFGKFHNMAFAYLFDSAQVIRFSQSPTGGGETNPAWDFQLLITTPKIGKEYKFKARMIYKPFISKEDIVQEYENWIIQ